MMKRLAAGILALFVVAGLLAAGPIAAQEDTNPPRALAIKAVYDNGAIKVRWATGSTVVWKLIRENGITLVKHDAEGTPQSIGPLTVYEESTWEAMADTFPTSAQIVQLLREDPDVTRGLTNLAANDVARTRLTGLLLITEFSFTAARGLAMGYIDTDIEAGKVYRYSVSLPDPFMGDTLSAECFVDTDLEVPVAPVMGLRAFAFDNQIALSWSQNQGHAGYMVEKRRSGSSTWAPASTRPIIFPTEFENKFMYRDSIPNYEPTEYRVYAFDGFQRRSEPTPTLEIFGRDRTPPAAPLTITANQVHDGLIQLEWTSPPPEPDLAGYAVLRSQNPEADYEPVHRELLPPPASTHADSVLETGTYFYRVISADTAGNVSTMSVRAMVVINDSIPPAAPVNVVSSADSTGIVTVSWNHVIENDVAGYRVYRRIRTREGDELLPLTGYMLEDSIFADTLTVTVRDHFAYAVRAVDFAGNTSDPSADTWVQLPDQLPPARPVIKDASTVDGRAWFTYVSMSQDVEHYTVNRYIGNLREPDTSVRRDTTAFEDTTLEDNVQYRFEVVAVDSAGNNSQPSKAVWANHYVKETVDTPEAPKVSFNKGKKEVKVSWKFPKGSGEKGWKVVVYRRTGDGKFRQLSPLTDAKNYTDKNVPGGVLEYAIQYYSDSGENSEMSAAARVDTSE